MHVIQLSEITSIRPLFKKEAQTFLILNKNNNIIPCGIWLITSITRPPLV